MDNSSSDTDSQPGLLLPYPYRVPGGRQRPLPDPLAIRLVAIPDFNPPFDDEPPAARKPASRVNQIRAGDDDGLRPLMANSDDELFSDQFGLCAAAWDELHATSHHEEPLPRWQPAMEQAAGPPESGELPPAERPGPAGDRCSHGADHGDDAGQWPSQFAQVLAETLAGARPASQLTPWTTERARAHIRRLGPLMAVDRRPKVQRVHASRPAADVVEVAVVAEFGPRTRALAARLERAAAEPATPGRRGREARWLCTAIESA